jgi:hypothetical protein
MKPLFAAVLVLACVAGSTNSFARGAAFAGAAGFAHGGGGLAHRSAPFFAEPAPQMPTFESRIPAPLAAPEQAPVINGPMSQPSLRGM